MLTGEIRGQVDRIWNVFWSGGISNPLEVIEQIVKAKKTAPCALSSSRTARRQARSHLPDVLARWLSRKAASTTVALSECGVLLTVKAAHRASLVGLDELSASLQHRAFRGEL